MLITRTWYLELDGIPMATPAWEIPNLSAFLDTPTLRGADRILPGVDGGIPYQRRVSPTVYTFPLDVVGLVDWDNAPVADPFEQLNIHMQYLRENLTASTGVGDGTIPAIFHRGDLDDFVGDVHFLGFKGTNTMGDGLLRTTFDISVPAGQLEALGS